MVDILCEITKYLIVFFMTIYTVKCFTVFTCKSEKDKRKIYNTQAFCIIVMHTCFYFVLYLQDQDVKILIYYGIQLFVAIMYMFIFTMTYKNASRLITNNITFLLIIGYTMLTQIKMDLSKKQFILATVGLILTAFIPFIIVSIKDIKNWNKFYGIVGIIFLLTVFIPGIGVEAYGSRNWISILGFSIQPMEFVKIIFVLFVASSLVKAEFLKDLIVNSIIAGIFVVILVLQKDLGGAVIFYMIYIMMVYLATSRIRFLIGGIILAVFGIVIGYILFKDSLFYHVMNRVNAWKDPWAYIDTSGYQVTQSLFAIGTGGFIGLGLGQGMPYMISVAESDFIFAAICEELGVLFGLALILITISSFLAIANISMKCRNPFYKYTAFGYCVCYIFQVLLNIGGVVKFIPSTGVTLPLVSYGVSSVISTLMVFSIVQGICIIGNKEAMQIEREKEKFKERQEIQFINN